MYQNVKHLMIPLKPIEPAQVAWIERTAQLVVAYSTEVHEESPSSQQLDSYFIQTGAELVWNSTGGKPCWSDLDVDAYLALHDRDAQWQGEAAVTMLAFLRWLVDCGHLEEKLSSVVLGRLEHHVNDWLRGMGLGIFCTDDPPASWAN